ncbi:unnamed protein product [Ascophyllum nodosum]
MSFLLNGLHEDLSRIIEKRHIELPDSDGRSDAALAEIWWNNYSQREFSIVVALFAGQFKNHLVCRECHHVSARFEPFMFIQVLYGWEKASVCRVEAYEAVKTRYPKTTRTLRLIREPESTSCHVGCRRCRG